MKYISTLSIWNHILTIWKRLWKLEYWVSNCPKSDKYILPGNNKYNSSTSFHSIYYSISMLWPNTKIPLWNQESKSIILLQIKQLASRQPFISSQHLTYPFCVFVAVTRIMRLSFLDELWQSNTWINWRLIQCLEFFF